MNHNADVRVLSELGESLAKVRLNRNWTQAKLAAEAGISKRTVERLEAGDSVQLASLIRVCRPLGLLARLEALFPASPASPIAQLKLRGKDRTRASVKRVPVGSAATWTWGDEE
jgi:transcriptional regulator with XRE-family HTH domain